ncbi:helix-turn-helix transcriptional regulator [Caulobacter sp.]|uniref:helix-turn-helix transcriptional regulator n=1 Tax=Caulobacter sp. TaxID=78 RepID=UPI001B2AEBCF|nr:helix-turn-helix transcriptional regulator [Caulobacter sp.]MBO9546044.1 helix-turn-helix domain-containing protein [Caulobacter sp.]
MNAPISTENPLGAFLRDRRARLDAAALGFSGARRRTPGLRREEVAQRAHISATWYTWLEQGRGGAASADVLDRIARALMLTEVEREHLFLLGLGRAPDVRYREAQGVTPRLQRVLDALSPSPALIKTPTWDVVAWNRAATLVLADYGELPVEERNILRRIFCDPRSRAFNTEWESVGRFVVAAFRADVARVGAGNEAGVQALIAELTARSPDFATMWADNDVRHYGEGIKRLRHPVLGAVAFEYSAFGVDGRPDLAMIVYNPATPEDLAAVKTLLV